MNIKKKIKEIKITCTNCGKKIPYSGNVCPNCNANKSEAKKKFNNTVVLVGFIVVFIIAYIIIEYQANSHVAPDSHHIYKNYNQKVIEPKKVEKEEKTVNSEFPGKWFSSTEGDWLEISRILVKNNISGCGVYYYKKGNSQGYYLVACSNDCNYWDYYLVYTGVKKVLGPYNYEDNGFYPSCD